MRFFETAEANLIVIGECSYKTPTSFCTKSPYNFSISVCTDYELLFFFIPST